MMRQPQIAKYVTGEIGAWKGARSDEEIVAAIRRTAYTGHHPCGTARMGHDNDTGAVLDSRLRVRGVQGLRVCDAAAMPGQITGNLYATVVAMAEKCAGHDRRKAAIVGRGRRTGASLMISEIKTFGYFVDNHWHKPLDGAYFESENPATGVVWARVPDCRTADVDRAVAAAKRAFYEGPWGSMLPAERGRHLRRIGDIISANAERLGEVETRDNGKLPNHITPGLRAGGWSVDSWHYYAGMCDKFEGRVIPAEAPDIHNYMKWEPFGVVAQILPWNSPIGTLIWKLAPCLAAGNTVVLKPSEQASCSTLELMDVLLEADLPEGVVNVVTGFGDTTGEPLVDHPDVRMVSFTGGTAGGRAVAAVAARKVKPVVMELGGKSPQIVFPDADLDLAVNGVASESSRRADRAASPAPASWFIKTSSPNSPAGSPNLPAGPGSDHRTTRTARSAPWPTGRITNMFSAASKLPSRPARTASGRAVRMP